jgi:hypothetical protein
LDDETGDESAVEEVECWEEFVGEEDVEGEQSFASVGGCV